MTTKDSRLAVQEAGGVTRVGFLDRNILDEASIQQIGDEISALIEQVTTPKLLIDFSNVQHLSSAALGTLIKVEQQVRKKHGQLRLSSIDKNIREIFEITKLDKMFQIHESNDQALASFK